MTHIDYTTALIRMGRYKLGIAEAGALFCLGDGATVGQVAKATKTASNITGARLIQLRRKKFVISERDRRTGRAIYRPSALGREVIRKTLNLKATPSEP